MPLEWLLPAAFLCTICSLRVDTSILKDYHEQVQRSLPYKSINFTHMTFETIFAQDEIATPEEETPEETAPAKQGDDNDEKEVGIETE